MNIITVIDVYDRKCRISQEDFDNPNRTQLPLYTARGNRFIDTQAGQRDFKNGKGSTHIHRLNIREVQP